MTTTVGAQETFPRTLSPEDLGKRVLVQSVRWTQIYYTRVKEFSPSGRYVQLASHEADMMDPGWIGTDQVTVLEVLPEVEAPEGHCPRCGRIAVILPRKRQ